MFYYPNIINLRVSSSDDISTTTETIAHEIIHLLIYKKVKKLQLTYNKIEGIVDLFFINTSLKKIFPKYKLQSIAKHDKNLFLKILK